MQGVNWLLSQTQIIFQKLQLWKISSYYDNGILGFCGAVFQDLILGIRKKKTIENGILVPLLNMWLL